MRAERFMHRPRYVMRPASMCTAQHGVMSSLFMARSPGNAVTLLHTVRCLISTTGSLCALQRVWRRNNAGQVPVPLPSQPLPHARWATEQTSKDKTKAKRSEGAQTGTCT